MNVIPVGGDGRVIVKRDPHATSVGGIDLPPSAVGQGKSTGLPRATFGTVLAVHEGCKLVEPGARVVFWELSGTDRLIDGETVTIMPAEELLGTLEE